MPTLEDASTISPTVIVSVGWSWLSEKVFGPIVMWSGTSKVVDGVTTPSSMAAATVTAFWIEPGSKTSVTARLRAGAEVGAVAVGRVEAGHAGHRQHVAGGDVEHHDRRADGVVLDHRVGGGLLGDGLDLAVEGEHEVGARLGRGQLAQARRDGQAGGCLLHGQLAGRAAEQVLVRRARAPRGRCRRSR